MVPDVGNVGGVGGIGPPDPVLSPQRRMSDDTGIPARREASARRAEPVPRQGDTVTVSETSRRFEIDAALRRVVLKVLDEHTGQVIRQVPPEEALAIAKVLDQIAEAARERRA